MFRLGTHSSALPPSIVSECCSNEEARQFYLCNGFEQTGMIENYYKRIEPPHCFILRKILKGKEKEVLAAEAGTKSDSA